MNRNAIPILRSNDLIHWYRDGFVFRAGHQPWWARASTGDLRGGRYWAPEVYRIGGRWIVYFAAEYDRARVHLPVASASRLEPGTMVLGVATSPTLRGPWRTRILHWSGEFGPNAAGRERVGGAIDPSTVRDPSTGRRYLFWVDQPDEIWAGRLSSDGTTLDSHVWKVLGQSRPWECDPASRLCFVEAPEPFYHDGRLYLLYSGGSTWDASYAVGVAIASDSQARHFVKRPQPILRTGRGFLGPGHTSHPVLGPDGSTYILYHALRRPSHTSSDRVLMLDRFEWVGRYPRVNDGRPG